MLRARGESWPLVGCIVAMLPMSPTFLLGLPFGIWGLTIQYRKDVAAAPSGAGPTAKAPIPGDSSIGERP
jgi:hypothetical protein